VDLHQTTLYVCDLVGNVLRQHEVETISGDAKNFFKICSQVLDWMIIL